MAGDLKYKSIRNFDWIFNSDGRPFSGPGFPSFPGRLQGVQPWFVRSCFYGFSRVVKK